MFWIKRNVNLIIENGVIRGQNIESGESVTIECKALVHPRTLMGDFFGAEKCIGEVMNKLAPKKFLLQGPTVYIQLLDKIEGGVTNVEARAFREAAVGSGARAIFVPKTTRALSSDQLLMRRFSNWDDA